MSSIDSKKKTSRRKNNEARRDVWVLIALALMVVIGVFLAMPPNEKINQGLDIQGGLSMVLTANSDDGSELTAENLDKSRAIIENRVNALGASEAVVAVQGDNQILVQIPGISNADEALNAIGQTGVLEFVEVDAIQDEDAVTRIKSGEEGVELEKGTYTPVITGENITMVNIGKASETSSYYAVNVTLDSAGASEFATLTTKLYPTHGLIAIVLDGKVQSAPAVQSAILDGHVAITGNYTLDEAKALQTILESGSLPVSFTYEQSQIVGPTLGQGELFAGVMAALIGLALVMLYLIFFYRGLGIITAANMAIFALLYLGVLAILSLCGVLSLSLAGIAGIILTIGMAADSSILIIERFKEEIRMGRSPKAASRSGVRHAITTSIDADLVSMISAICLFVFATASVKGFGLTLGLGIICDIIVMFMFKGPIIRLLAPKVIADHPGVWGIKKDFAVAEERKQLNETIESQISASNDSNKTVSKKKKNRR